MAPAREKWIRRFIIPEVTRHKRGFTIYKVTSVVFLKASREEISKVSVWKRYNDFKKLHSQLSTLYNNFEIKEPFPLFPKSRFFNRFEMEVIEERKEYALKFLEFIGRHSHLYSSDIFIRFFETSHVNSSMNDCSHSISSDTSEDDRQITINNFVSMNNVFSENIQSIPEPLCGTMPHFAHTNQISLPISPTMYGKNELTDLNKKYNDSNGHVPKIKEFKEQDATKGTDGLLIKDEHFHDTNVTTVNVNQKFNCENNYKKDTLYTTRKKQQFFDYQGPSHCENGTTEKIMSPMVIYNGSDLLQAQKDSAQYILTAAVHMSAAFRHEAVAEYAEAFTQYKMGISSLLIGIQSDPDTNRAIIIKEKISKYLERAEKLYNRHINCNISVLSKPVSELGNYKVHKILRSVMLVRDTRINCLRIIKTVEKTADYKDNISNYILQGQVPYMAKLHACIETETTIFLILEYARQGTLWNVVTLHYKLYGNTHFCSTECLQICNHISNKQNTSEEVLSINCTELIKKKVNDNVNTCAPYKINSSSEKLENNNIHSQESIYTIQDHYKLYSDDMPTTQLLEKAQKLLQSVNATLKRSNSVVNRLTESGQLTHYEENTLPNEMNCTSHLEKLNVTLSDNYKISTNSTSSDIQNKESVIEQSEQNVDSSITDKLTCNSKNINDNEKLSIKPLKYIETQKVLNNNQINNYLISNDQKYLKEAIWSDSCKTNNMNEEQIYWNISETKISIWAAEILLALEGLHQRKILIMDLNPDNVLLDDNGHILLTYIVPRHHSTVLLKYKPPYSSPELCAYSPTVSVTSATDIWSFGVILYELLTGMMFQSNHTSPFHSHSILNIPNTVSKDAQSLLLDILKYQPSERLKIPEIKQHTFFAQIDWLGLMNV